MNGHDYEELKKIYFSYIRHLPYFGSKDFEIDASKRRMNEIFAIRIIMGITLIFAGAFAAMYGFHNGMEGAFNSDKRDVPLVILAGMMIIGVIMAIVGIYKTAKCSDYLACMKLYDRVNADETLNYLGDWIKEERINKLLLRLPAVNRTLLTVAEMVTLIETIEEEANNAAKEKLHTLITG
jgi:hypothetical protein